MAEPQIIEWRDGRVVDTTAAPAAVRPWSFIAALLGFILLADLGLGWFAAQGKLDQDFDPRDAAGLRRVLTLAANDPDEPYLLIGDSVIAGDVLRGKVDDWRERRVIDAMRTSVHPESRARFHQVGLDALLPVDIQHIVQELDAVDPFARVPVVIELNPRYFSRSYAQDGDCTRPWLCEVGPTLLTNTELRWSALGRWLARVGLGAVAERVPLLRHRSWLNIDAVERGIEALVSTGAPEASAPTDLLSARARNLAHYQELVTDNGSRQVKALQATVARLRATGRRALFFSTPLEDEFVAEAMSEWQYGRYIGRLSELIDRGSPAQVELVNLDHPLFSSPLFLDHCHLGPEGNRRLAVNLLAELGVGLALVPDDDELVDLDGPDRTVVGRPGLGFSDGAAWQALFDRPRGMAVAPGGRRIVIADTFNHVLRELSGNLQTVRTLAGRPGANGDKDGRRHAARLDRPSHPVLIGDAVYFADQSGGKLRALIDGNVSTMTVSSGPTWGRVNRLQADGDHLLVLDGGRRILEFDPRTGESWLLVDTSEGMEIKVFAAAPDGRLYFADKDDRIWVGERDDAPHRLGDAQGELRLEYPNNTGVAMPQGKGLYFPMPYGRIRFENIVGMVWVERYGTLLVQDDIPTERKAPGLTERIHLRMLDPQSKQVYPWIKPLVHGGGYAHYNGKSRSFSSYFHEGSMAMDQGTATLFWLERNRSRLFYVADGVLGGAKVGHIKDLLIHGFRDQLGHNNATRTFEAFAPQRFLDRRLERHPRQGPYQGLIIGSSMLSKSDMIGSYSFGVRLEQRLRGALGLRDGIGFELYQRSYGGVPSEVVLQELGSMLATGAQLDVIFVELCGSRNRFFETGASDGRMREILAEFDAIARRHDSLVVFFDDSALVSNRHDGNRGAPAHERRFMEMARAAGFEVITLGEELMRDSLELSPFGSPGYRSHHASPWAIDEAADMLGDRAYPVVREHLRGRVPAFLRAAVDEQVDSAAIADAFDEVPANWGDFLPTVTDASAQSTLVGDELQIFVDLGRITVDVGDLDALDDVAASALHMYIALDPAGARARRVHVQLAHFSRYDEYGAGVRDAAEIVRSHRLDRAGLIEFLRGVRTRWQQ